MTGILAFFRFVGWRNLLLVILAIAVFFLIRTQFFPKNPAAPRVISLFDRVEYVRELRLVTFYSEELLEIGVQDALSRKVERQEEAVENAVLLRTQLAQKNELANGYAAKAAANRISLERRLRFQLRERDSLVSNFRDVDPGRRVTARELQRILQDHPNAYSPELRNKVRMWATLPNSQAEKKLFEEEIKSMAETESENKRASHKIELQKLDGQIAQVREFLDQAKEEEKRAEREARNSNSEASQAYLQFRQDSVLLVELKIELVNQQVNPLPKLIAVVSTEVTAFVDLEGMDSDIEDNMLTLCGVTSARVDSNVRINLSSDNRYLTAKNLTILSTGKSENEIEMGVYYHVYEEMKEALVEMKSKVISDAIERGLLVEADQMARNYLEQMGRSLGFGKVVVKESCEEPKPASVLAQEASDSILIQSEDIRRRVDSLEAFMSDNLGIDTDSLQDEILIQDSVRARGL
ncbi:MAG: DUF4230 domain-containing protein [Bacteroidia bacterium]|nr:DUF4230 domain-containing protein [Bacteroidia bacterium]